MWTDSKCRSLITTASMVSLDSIFQNAEAGHFGCAPGVLEYWSNSIADLGKRNADCVLYIKFLISHSCF